MHAFKSLALVASLSLLAACASQDASAPSVQPENASSVINFPNVAHSYLKTGDFIDPASVRRVMLGLHKDQTRLLLGNPHFGEGVFGVNLWDYVFNFYVGNNNGRYITCQYQVHFDDQNKIAATYWSAPACAAIVNPPEKPKVLPPPPPAPEKRELTFSADALFDFDSATLTAAGLQSLNQLVGTLKREADTIQAIEVIGHADRIGSADYNLRLSSARAEGVAQFLRMQGVNQGRVSARGVGASQPVVSCEGTQVNATLIACLQPNRRVTVEILARE